MTEREFMPQKLRALARTAALTELQRDELFRMAQHGIAGDRTLCANGASQPCVATEHRCSLIAKYELPAGMSERPIDQAQYDEAEQHPAWTPGITPAGPQ